MKSITKLALLAGIAGMCFAAEAFGPIAVGGFTLPYQTSWGRAVLPAGHYTFILDRYGYATAQKTILLQQGTKMIAIVLAQVSEPASSSDSSSMGIVNQRVRSLHLAPVGLTYYFPESKKRRELLAGDVRVPGVSAIPVSVK
ncbi:MAG: hypothetical protein ACRD19_15520 [Terriglobia bacterium]